MSQPFELLVERPSVVVSAPGVGRTTTHMELREFLPHMARQDDQGACDDAAVEVAK